MIDWRSFVKTGMCLIGLQTKRTLQYCKNSIIQILIHMIVVFSANGELISHSRFAFENPSHLIENTRYVIIIVIYWSLNESI